MGYFVFGENFLQAFLKLGDKINRTVINKDVSTFYENKLKKNIIFSKRLFEDE